MVITKTVTKPVTWFVPFIPSPAHRYRDGELPTRRLSRDDDGATIIFVTLAMAAHAAHGVVGTRCRQHVLQQGPRVNSADARALAAAVNCAQGKAIDTILPGVKTEHTIPPPDGLSIGSCAGHNQVTATVSQPQDFQFMPMSHTVTRTATAKWGTIASSNVSPITIASCDFSQALLDGTAYITLYRDDPKPQSGCSSLPGGFSQLQSGDTQCSIEVDANGSVAGKPGGDLTRRCRHQPLPIDVFVPIYNEQGMDPTAHNNGHGPYPILGYAMFHVTGYPFNGNANAGTLQALPGTAGRPGADPKYCIRGDFIRMLAPGEAMPGPSQDFGVTKVYLTYSPPEKHEGPHPS